MDAPLPENNTTNDSIHLQNVVVMRHGDRIDSLEPLWVTTASRPWDPPLVEAGRIRAFCTGRKLKTDLGFPIHRVFVSPFLRCIQTASEVVSALCAVGDGPDVVSSRGVTIDSSKLKVSIEYGLCEMLNREAIRSDCAPKDGNFGFNISELEAMLPTGTVDHAVKPVYEELPQWEETVMGARTRYEQIIKALTDKYPLENLLLVTHGDVRGLSCATLQERWSLHGLKLFNLFETLLSIDIGQKWGYSTCQDQPTTPQTCNQSDVDAGITE